MSTDPAKFDNPRDIPDHVEAHDLWEDAPDPTTVEPIDFPTQLDDYEWTIHFGQRAVEDPRPPDLATVDEVLRTGEFRNYDARDFAFEQEYEGVTVRVVVGITDNRPIRPILITAYIIVPSLRDAAMCDRFPQEEVHRAYARSALDKENSSRDQLDQTEWSIVEFSRELDVNGHTFVGERHRPYPRCENCGKRFQTVGGVWGTPCPNSYTR